MSGQAMSIEMFACIVAEEISTLEKLHLKVFFHGACERIKEYYYWVVAENIEITSAKIFNNGFLILSLSIKSSFLLFLNTILDSME